MRILAPLACAVLAALSSACSTSGACETHFGDGSPDTCFDATKAESCTSADKTRTLKFSANVKCESLGYMRCSTRASDSLLKNCR